jgi:hypothetical protein
VMRTAGEGDWEEGWEMEIGGRGLE